MAGYEWRVSLQSNTGFVLDTDKLDTGALGFLTTPLTDSRVKIRSVNISGGRNRELEAIPPSTATIVFDNRDGLFNPDNSTSPYYGLIFPGKSIQLEYVNKISGIAYNQSISVFYGFVTEWTFSFDLNGDAVATVSAKDLFGSLADVTIPATSVTQESTAARFTRICALAGFNPGQVTSNGSFSTLSAATISGNAAQLAQDVLFQEQGSYWVLGSSIFFNARNTLPNGYNFFFTNTSETVTNIPTYPFNSLEIAYSNDSVANSVTTNSPLGTAVITDAAKVATYGKTSASYDVAYSSFGQQNDLTGFLVNTYGAPQFRPKSMTVSVDSLLTLGNQFNSNLIDGYTAYNFISATYVYGLPVRVKFDPPGDGDVIDKKLIISSWNHSSTPAGYDITIGLEINPFQDVFVLDSATFGVLNSNKLGF